MVDVDNELPSPTPKEYISIRVFFIHVKKTWLGFRDTELKRVICIPSSIKDVKELEYKIGKLFSEYGVEFDFNV